MELLRFIGRITLITQGYPHVTVVRIEPGTYGNAGIPYFNMIPPRATPAELVPTDEEPTTVPRLSLVEEVTYHNIVRAIGGTGICSDYNVSVRRKCGLII